MKGPNYPRRSGNPKTRRLVRHHQALNSIEPPWYGPVCPVVWEGRSREAPPYPDHCLCIRKADEAWGEAARDNSLADTRFWCVVLSDVVSLIQ